MAKPKLDKPFRATKAAVEAVKNATNRCFHDAENEMKQKWDKLGLKYELENGWGWKTKYNPEFQEELDQLYRQKLCYLQTKVLEGIIICHEKGKYSRAAITLEAVRNELTRRHLLGDFSTPN